MDVLIDELRQRWNATCYWDEDGFTGLPHRYYMLLVASEWSGEKTAFVYDFEDAREAMAFVRFCLVPGSLTNDTEAPDVTDIMELAGGCFETGSQRFALMAELLAACDAMLVSSTPVGGGAVDHVIDTFNRTFASSVDGGGDELMHAHRIEAHGGLADILRASDLEDESEWAADMDEAFEHAELASLVRHHELDDDDLRHLALAGSFLERYPYTS